MPLTIGILIPAPLLGKVKFWRFINMADSGRGDDMTRRLTPLIIIIAAIFAVLSALGKTAPSVGFNAASK